MSLDMEGSSPPRPPAQTLPRSLPRILPGAKGQLSTPGSDLEHRAHLPGSQVEDQEPPEAQPKVTGPEQAGAGEDARDQKQDHQDPAGDLKLPPAAPAEPEDPAAPADLAAPEDPASPAPAPAPGPLGSGEPVQASSPPGAEPPLHPPTPPKSQHESPPPPALDFPTPEVVFVLFFFS
ncbi:predicted GPI-anchored protein 58 [Camelus ferus]|uniref:Predicted GPI-anchored protein 58 n=1 Tax=Camelus ferus TaxID=419612 RepID=A0A8B8S912_CAMFR|nr:predicted GPI-anchored protein 58 [Camelus ferus]